MLAGEEFLSCDYMMSRSIPGLCPLGASYILPVPGCDSCLQMLQVATEARELGSETGSLGSGSALESLVTQSKGLNLGPPHLLKWK